MNDLPPLSAYMEEVDREDGALDGKWRDNDIEQYEQGWATPARIPYQSRMIEEVIAREGFGDDDVPDLLFINNKAIDHVSHIWSVNSPEMADTLRWQDEDLGAVRRRSSTTRSGAGEWVLVLTADHGAQFDPEVSGAFQVTPGQLGADLEAAFPSVDGRVGVPRGADEPDLPERGRDGRERLLGERDRAVRPRVHEGAGRGRPVRRCRPTSSTTG